MKGGAACILLRRGPCFSACGSSSGEPEAAGVGLPAVEGWFDSTGAQLILAARCGQRGRRYLSATGQWPGLANLGGGDAGPDQRT